MIFVLRKATDKDLDLIYEIKKNALYEYIHQLGGWHEEEQRSFHETAFSASNYQIVEVIGKPIGYIELNHNPTFTFLANVMVIKQFQRQGFGTVIIEDLMKSVPEVQLAVLKINTQAQALYLRLGFTIYEENEDSFLMKYARDNQVEL
jgi:ribosomal protein S18 acetylase RimI-like enzyme